ncbi:MAG: Yip1 family protein [Haloferacaceae archaeon]
MARTESTVKRAVAEVLTRPRRFFEREDRFESALAPLLVVLSLAVVSLLSLLPAYLSLLASRPLPGFGPFVLAFGGTAVRTSRLSATVVFGIVAAPFLVWALHGAALHLLARPFASGGSLRRTLVVTGWGYLPQVGATAVTLLATVAIAVSSPDAAPSAFGVTLAGHAAVRGKQLTPLYVGAELVGIAGTLWSGYVWYGGLRAVSGLSRRQAALVVGGLVFVLVDTTVLGRLLG